MSIFNPERYDHVVSLNIDIQNDFCPGGSLAVADGDQVVEPMNRVNEFVRARNGTVLFTRDWHPRETNHFNTSGGPWPPHCIAYQAGAAFHEDLIVDTRAGDLVASKGTLPDRDDYSGLMAVMDTRTIWDGRDHYRPSLAMYLTHGLRNMQVTKEKTTRLKAIDSLAILIGGLATDYCVKATVLDLLELRKTNKRLQDMGIFIIEDAIRAVNVNEKDGAVAIQEMSDAGAEFIKSKNIPLSMEAQLL